MRHTILTLTVLACFTLGCGSGSDCAPEGTWTIWDTPTWNTGGGCAGYPSSSTSMVLSDAGYWSEDNGRLYSSAGSLDGETCRATAKLVGTFTFQEMSGWTATMQRAVTFTGDTLAGASDLTIQEPAAYRGAVAGFPCSVHFRTTGVRSL